MKFRFKNNRFKDNRGAALIELALVSPLFFILMVGACEMARVAYYAIEVENAARAGASFGAVNIGNAGLEGTVEQAAMNDAPDISNLIVVTKGNVCVCEQLTVSSDSPSFNPTSGTTDCLSSTITGCTANSSTTLDSVIEYVTVSTSANINPLIHIPGLPSTYNLSGYSAMRILSN